MASRFEWVKLILDKWAVILPVILFIASATGLSFSMIDNNDKDTELKATQKQIATIANHYKRKKYVDKQTKLHKKREH
jgi:hypothetical protein